MRTTVSTLALAALLWAGAGGATGLPDLGEESATILSPAEEKTLGGRFIRNARQKLDFVDDPEIQEYIQSLGERLAGPEGATPYDFRFFVIADDALNAFAVPGGFIAVHSGLILASETEGELASVLAHEVTHVAQRHIPRMLSGAKQRSLPMLAALIGAILLGGRAGQAAVAAASAYNLQEQIRFTRSFEREADRLGMEKLVSAGFDPHAMPRFFRRLQNRSRLYESGLPEFLRTHPVTSDRIAESWSRADSYGPQNDPDPSAFFHARARLRVLTAASPAKVVQFFEGVLATSTPADLQAERYGYALALRANRQFAQARQIIRELLAARPGHMPYLIAQAETEQAAGQHAQALALYEAAYRKYPQSLPLAYRYGDALLKADRNRKAQAVLTRAVERRDDDPALQFMLATAAGNAGQRVTAHRALAEYYYLNGNLQAAVRELRRAEGLARGNRYLAARVAARLEQVQAEFDATREEQQNGRHS